MTVSGVCEADSMLKEMAVAVASAVGNEGKREAKPIPERRPLDKQMKGLGVMEPEKKEKKPAGSINATNRRLYYCKQCGYVVFRDEPPYMCPICKAKREMFQEIVTTQGYYTRTLV